MLFVEPEVDCFRLRLRDLRIPCVVLEQKPDEIARGAAAPVASSTRHTTALLNDGPCVNGVDSEKAKVNNECSPRQRSSPTHDTMPPNNNDGARNTVSSVSSFPVPSQRPSFTVSASTRASSNSTTSTTTTTSKRATAPADDPLAHITLEERAEAVHRALLSALHSRFPYELPDTLENVYVLVVTHHAAPSLSSQPFTADELSYLTTHYDFLPAELRCRTFPSHLNAVLDPAWTAAASAVVSAGPCTLASAASQQEEQQHQQQQQQGESEATAARSETASPSAAPQRPSIRVTDGALQARPDAAAQRAATPAESTKAETASATTAAVAAAEALSSVAMAPRFFDSFFLLARDLTPAQQALYYETQCRGQIVPQQPRHPSLASPRAASPTSAQQPGGNDKNNNSNSNKNTNSDSEVFTVLHGDFTHFIPANAEAASAKDATSTLASAGQRISRGNGGYRRVTGESETFHISPNRPQDVGSGTGAAGAPASATDVRALHFSVYRIPLTRFQPDDQQYYAGQREELRWRQRRRYQAAFDAQRRSRKEKGYRQFLPRRTGERDSSSSTDSDYDIESDSSTSSLEGEGQRKSGHLNNSPKPSRQKREFDTVMDQLFLNEATTAGGEQCTPLEQQRAAHFFDTCHKVLTNYAVAHASLADAAEEPLSATAAPTTQATTAETVTAKVTQPSSAGVYADGSGGTPATRNSSKPTEAAAPAPKAATASTAQPTKRHRFRGVSFFGVTRLLYSFAACDCYHLVMKDNNPLYYAHSSRASYQPQIVPLSLASDLTHDAAKTSHDGGAEGRGRGAAAAGERVNRYPGAAGAAGGRLLAGTVQNRATVLRATAGRCEEDVVRESAEQDNAPRPSPSPDIFGQVLLLNSNVPPGSRGGSNGCGNQGGCVDAARAGEHRTATTATAADSASPTMQLPHETPSPRQSGEAQQQQQQQRWSGPSAQGASPSAEDGLVRSRQPSPDRLGGSQRISAPGLFAGSGSARASQVRCEGKYSTAVPTGSAAASTEGVLRVTASLLSNSISGNPRRTEKSLSEKGARVPDFLLPDAARTGDKNYNSSASGASVTSAAAADTAASSTAASAVVNLFRALAESSLAQHKLRYGAIRSVVSVAVLDNTPRLGSSSSDGGVGGETLGTATARMSNDQQDGITQLSGGGRAPMQTSTRYCCRGLVDHTWLSLPVQRTPAEQESIQWMPVLLGSTECVSDVGLRTAVHLGIFPPSTSDVSLREAERRGRSSGSVAGSGGRPGGAAGASEGKSGLYPTREGVLASLAPSLKRSSARPPVSSAEKQTSAALASGTAAAATSVSATSNSVPSSVAQPLQSRVVNSASAANPVTSAPQQQQQQQQQQPSGNAKENQPFCQVSGGPVECNSAPQKRDADGFVIPTVTGTVHPKSGAFSALSPLSDTTAPTQTRPALPVQAQKSAECGGALTQPDTRPSSPRFSSTMAADPFNAAFAAARAATTTSSARAIPQVQLGSQAAPQELGSAAGSASPIPAIDPSLYRASATQNPFTRLTTVAAFAQNFNPQQSQAPPPPQQQQQQHDRKAIRWAQTTQPVTSPAPNVTGSHLVATPKQTKGTESRTAALQRASWTALSLSRELAERSWQSGRRRRDDGDRADVETIQTDDFNGGSVAAEEEEAEEFISRRSHEDAFIENESEEEGEDVDCDLRDRNCENEEANERQENAPNQTQLRAAVPFTPPPLNGFAARPNPASAPTTSVRSAAAIPNPFYMYPPRETAPASAVAAANGGAGSVATGGTTHTPPRSPGLPACFSAFKTPASSAVPPPPGSHPAAESFFDDAFGHASSAAPSPHTPSPRRAVQLTPFGQPAEPTRNVDTTPARWAAQSGRPLPASSAQLPASSFSSSSPSFPTARPNAAAAQNNGGPPAQPGLPADAGEPWPRTSASPFVFNASLSAGSCNSSSTREKTQAVWPGTSFSQQQQELPSQQWQRQNTAQVPTSTTTATLDTEQYFDFPERRPGRGAVGPCGAAHHPESTTPVSAPEYFANAWSARKSTGVAVEPQPRSPRVQQQQGQQQQPRSSFFSSAFSFPSRKTHGLRVTTTARGLEQFPNSSLTNTDNNTNYVGTGATQRDATRSSVYPTTTPQRTPLRSTLYSSRFSAYSPPQAPSRYAAAHPASTEAATPAARPPAGVTRNLHYNLCINEYDDDAVKARALHGEAGQPTYGGPSSTVRSRVRPRGVCAMDAAWLHPARELTSAPNLRLSTAYASGAAASTPYCPTAATPRDSAQLRYSVSVDQPYNVSDLNLERDHAMAAAAQARADPYNIPREPDTAKAATRGGWAAAEAARATHSFYVSDTREATTMADRNSAYVSQPFSDARRTFVCRAEEAFDGPPRRSGTPAPSIAILGRGPSLKPASAAGASPFSGLRTRFTSGHRYSALRGGVVRETASATATTAARVPIFYERSPEAERRRHEQLRQRHLNAYQLHLLDNYMCGSALKKFCFERPPLHPVDSPRGAAQRPNGEAATTAPGQSSTSGAPPATASAAWPPRTTDVPPSLPTASTTSLQADGRIAAAAAAAANTALGEAARAYSLGVHPAASGSTQAATADVTNTETRQQDAKESVPSLLAPSGGGEAPGLTAQQAEAHLRRQAEQEVCMEARRQMERLADGEAAARLSTGVNVSFTLRDIAAVFLRLPTTTTAASAPTSRESGADGGFETLDICQAAWRPSGVSCFLSRRPTQLRGGWESYLERINLYQEPFYLREQALILLLPVPHVPELKVCVAIHNVNDVVALVCQTPLQRILPTAEEAWMRQRRYGWGSDEDEDEDSTDINSSDRAEGEGVGEAGGSGGSTRATTTRETKRRSTVVLEERRWLFGLFTSRRLIKNSGSNSSNNGSKCGDNRSSFRATAASPTSLPTPADDDTTRRAKCRALRRQYQLDGLRLTWRHRARIWLALFEAGRTCLALPRCTSPLLTDPAACRARCALLCDRVAAYAAVRHRLVTLQAIRQAYVERRAEELSRQRLLKLQDAPFFKADIRLGGNQSASAAENAAARQINSGVGRNATSSATPAPPPTANATREAAGSTLDQPYAPNTLAQVNTASRYPLEPRVRLGEGGAGMGDFAREACFPPTESAWTALHGEGASPPATTSARLLRDYGDRFTGSETRRGNSNAEGATTCGGGLAECSRPPSSRCGAPNDFARTEKSAATTSFLLPTTAASVAAYANHTSLAPSRTQSSPQGQQQNFDAAAGTTPASTLALSAAAASAKLDLILHVERDDALARALQRLTELRASSIAPPLTTVLAVVPRAMQPVRGAGAGVTDGINGLSPTAENTGKAGVSGTAGGGESTAGGDPLYAGYVPSPLEVQRRQTSEPFNISIAQMQQLLQWQWEHHQHSYCLMPTPLFRGAVVPSADFTLLAASDPTVQGVQTGTTLTQTRHAVSPLAREIILHLARWSWLLPIDFVRTQRTRNCGSAKLARREGFGYLSWIWPSSLFASSRDASRTPSWRLRRWRVLALLIVFVVAVQYSAECFALALSGVAAYFLVNGLTVGLTSRLPSHRRHGSNENDIDARAYGSTRQGEWQPRLLLFWGPRIRLVKPWRRGQRDRLYRHYQRRSCPSRGGAHPLLFSQLEGEVPPLQEQVSLLHSVSEAATQAQLERRRVHVTTQAVITCVLRCQTCAAAVLSRVQLALYGYSTTLSLWLVVLCLAYLGLYVLYASAWRCLGWGEVVVYVGGDVGGHRGASFYPRRTLLSSLGNVSGTLWRYCWASNSATSFSTAARGGAAGQVPFEFLQHMSAAAWREVLEPVRYLLLQRLQAAAEVTATKAAASTPLFNEEGTEEDKLFSNIGGGEESVMDKNEISTSVAAADAGAVPAAAARPSYFYQNGRYYTYDAEPPAWAKPPLSSQVVAETPKAATTTSAATMTTTIGGAHFTLAGGDTAGAAVTPLASTSARMTRSLSEWVSQLIRSDGASPVATEIFASAPPAVDARFVNGATRSSASDSSATNNASTTLNESSVQRTPYAVGAEGPSLLWFLVLAYFVTCCLPRSPFRWLWRRLWGVLTHDDALARRPLLTV